MKILLLYYEPQPSGQTTHVLALASELVVRGHAVTVVLPERLRSCIPDFEFAGCVTVPLVMPKLLWPFHSMSALFHLIRHGNFALVHVHSQEAGIAGRVIARVAGVRNIIYTPQVIDIRRVRLHWLYVLFERVLARITQRIISVSVADRQRMIQWGIAAHKVVTIPNGIDLRLFEMPTPIAEIRQRLGLSIAAAGPLIMQVGRLSAQKAPLDFVAGAAQVLKIHPAAQFVWIGEGPLHATVLARIAELQLGDKIHLVGWHPRAVNLMPAATVITLTSHWEGVPFVLLEALAWAKPVVATAVNGCAEIIVSGKSGLLVPPHNVPQWSQCVIDLLNQPTWAADLGQQGRQRIEENFALTSIVSKIEQLYGEW